MKHCMIDIETMGNTGTAAIVSLGAIAFDPYTKECEANFYHNITLESSLRAGLTVNADTMWWWINPARAEAAKDLLDPMPWSLKRTLHAFSEWFKENKLEFLWSHGSTFDAVIVENAYRAIQHKCPYHWRNIRDTRTLFALVDLTTQDWEDASETCPKSHNALHDAIRQAKVVQTAHYKLAHHGYKESVFSE